MYDELLVSTVLDGVEALQHRGRLVILDPTGDVLLSRGDADAAVFARSVLKPFRSVATLVTKCSRSTHSALRRWPLVQARTVGHCSTRVMLSGFSPEWDWIERLSGAALVPLLVRMRLRRSMTDCSLSANSPVTAPVSMPQRSLQFAIHVGGLRRSG